MQVRPVEHDDIAVCIELGKAMHLESRYRDYEFNQAKIENLISATFTQQDMCSMFVAEEDGVIIGLLIGICAEYWFGTDKQTADLAIYVIPEKRGSSAVGRLIRIYEKWAVGIGVKEVGVSTSTGVQPERTGRLFERLGYAPTAYTYSKRIKE